MSYVQQLGGRQPDGTTVAGATTDLVSVYGVTPVAQAAAVTALTTGCSTTEISVAVNAIATAIKNFGITA